jgi:hypothetical protein
VNGGRTNETRTTTRVANFAGGIGPATRELHHHLDGPRARRGRRHIGCRRRARRGDVHHRPHPRRRDHQEPHRRQLRHPDHERELSVAAFGDTSVSRAPVTRRRYRRPRSSNCRSRRPCSLGHPHRARRRSPWETRDHRQGSTPSPRPLTHRPARPLLRRRSGTSCIRELRSRPAEEPRIPGDARGDWLTRLLGSPSASSIADQSAPQVTWRPPTN